MVSDEISFHSHTPDINGKANSGFYICLTVKSLECVVPRHFSSFLLHRNTTTLYRRQIFFSQHLCVIDHNITGAWYLWWRMVNWKTQLSEQRHLFSFPGLRERKMTSFDRIAAFGSSHILVFGVSSEIWSAWTRRHSLSFFPPRKLTYEVLLLSFLSIVKHHSPRTFPKYRHVCICDVYVSKSNITRDFRISPTYFFSFKVASKISSPLLIYSSRFFMYKFFIQTLLLLGFIKLKSLMWTNVPTIPCRCSRVLLILLKLNCQNILMD